MYNQKLLIPHQNSLNEGNQPFSPPSTTLTPSSTPSNTPTPSSSSIPTPNIAQIASLASSHMANQPMVSPFMLQQGINQVFNNGMMNTALYNDPALVQLYFANFFQGNHGYMPSIYPYSCGYNPCISGGSTTEAAIINGTKVEMPIAENIQTSQTSYKDNIEAKKNLLIKSNNTEKLVKTIACDNLGQAILSTPERTKQENIASKDKIEINEGLEHTIIDDASIKKRRKECSIDSVNSIVETVATETNSNMDECSAKKKLINEVETRSFEISQEDETENTGEDEDNSENTANLVDNQIESVQSSPQYLHLKSEDRKANANGFNSSIGGGNAISNNSHEDELFLSNDRKTPFDKIMRIHSSLIGSLSWTAPTDKDDTILKTTKENGANYNSETSNNNNNTTTDISNKTSSTNKHDETNKSLSHNGQDEYNPFIQREYNSANVTCFSPRMLPDWQLNWLRDVTRSLSSVPKSPMTGIHFDRTKPAWAVSYYECETRKYYFFFIPDLSEYTIEITLAAAIGCRQNVVARGAHKRKKPGVLTFNLYSGQFEKSAPETPTSGEGGPEHPGLCNQRFRKSSILLGSSGCNSNIKTQCGVGTITHPSSGAISTTINNSIASEFSHNNPQTHPNSHHLHAIFAPNRNHLNMLDPSMPTLNNFHVASQMHAHPHPGPAQILFPHMPIGGQHHTHPAAMASLMHGAPHAFMMDAFQQNALRNASLLYAAALSSSGSIHNTVPPIAVPASVGPAIGVVPPSAGNVESNVSNCTNQIILPSTITAASTAPNTPTNSTNNMKTITEHSVVSTRDCSNASSNANANANANDTENITCTTKTDSACVLSAPILTPVISSSSVNAGDSGVC